MSICLSVRLSVYLSVFVCLCVLCMHTCVHVCMYVCTCACVCMCVCTHVHCDQLISVTMTFVGRVARAGRSGMAFSMVSNDEVNNV